MICSNVLSKHERTSKTQREHAQKEYYQNLTMFIQEISFVCRQDQFRQQRRQEVVYKDSLMGRMSTFSRLGGDVGRQATSVTANFGQTQDVRISRLLDHASSVFLGD